MMTRISICMALVAIVSGVTVVTQSSLQAPAPDLLIDGHVHITNRVYWEGIDPWKPQPVGQFDYARARQGGVNVVIESIGPVRLPELQRDREAGRPAG